MNFQIDLKMFKLKFKKYFLKKEEKLTKNNTKLRKDVDKTIYLLAKNPNNPILKSHKIIRKNGQNAFSSKVDNNFRIIWNYQKNEAQILDIIDIGGHSGKDKVYN